MSPFSDFLHTSTEDSSVLNVSVFFVPRNVGSLDVNRVEKYEINHTALTDVSEQILNLAI